jgi:diacylglycerol kinase
MATQSVMTSIPFLYLQAVLLSGGNGSPKKLLNNMKSKSISLHERVNSIRYAVEGIIKFFSEEPNAWIHLVATILVFVLAFTFHLAGTEKLALVIVTGMVWVAEAFNTVVEKIMDHISPERHPRVKFIKDLSAGAVLLSAITALITGAIVFIPKIF